MAGHIRKRGDKWQAIIEEAPDPKTGKRNRIYRTLSATTKREAEKQLRELQTEVDNKTYVKDSTVTVEKYMLDWLETYIKPYKSPTTYASYSLNVKSYIIAKFGRLKLQDLTTIEIQKFYNSLKVKSCCSDKPLTPKTIRNVHMNFNAALKKAVQLELLRKNPAEYIELEQCKRYIADVYDTEEIAALYEAAKDTDMELPIMILICLGVRRGELLALTWNDVDFDTGLVSITKNYVSVKGERITKLPKTQSSIRKIESPKQLVKMLREAKIDYACRKLKLGSKFKDNNLIICQEDGSPYAPESFSKKFKDFLIKNNLKVIRLHDMRHTNATLMLRLGISAKVAQKRLGHSTYATTMDTYSHVLEEMEHDATEVLDMGLQKIL